MHLLKMVNTNANVLTPFVLRRLGLGLGLGLGVGLGLGLGVGLGLGLGVGLGLGLGLGCGAGPRVAAAGSAQVDSANHAVSPLEAGSQTSA
jgi:hypothetical protein